MILRSKVFLGVIAVISLLQVSACANGKKGKLNGAAAMTHTFSEGGSALQARLQSLVDAQIGRNKVYEIALSVSHGNSDDVIHVSSAMKSEGGSQAAQVFDAHSPYFTASTAKLFATTLILQLVDENKLSLDDSLVQFFPADELHGLHVLKGIEHTNAITVRQLMAHTSGLADYFDDKGVDGKQFSKTLMNNQDSQWSVSDIVQRVKTDLTPHFVPGAKGKAHYSDTNFQLLGAIIENVTNQSLAENVDLRIAKPLGLPNTYLFTRESVVDKKSVLPLRFKNNILDISMAMESVRLDGGIVSTSADSLVFIKSFMRGQLFDDSHLDELQIWNSIGFPLKAGVGILKFKLPGILTPFRTSPVLIGHSGVSGAFAFYSPSSDLYMAGTLNQLEDQTLPYKFMMKVIAAESKSER